jgi:nucleoside-specific outer membrane channel protein Tsx
VKGKNSLLSSSVLAAHDATLKKEDMFRKSSQNNSKIWMMYSLEDKGLVAVYLQAVIIFLWF